MCMESFASISHDFVINSFYFLNCDYLNFRSMDNEWGPMCFKQYPYSIIKLIPSSSQRDVAAVCEFSCISSCSYVEKIPFHFIFFEETDRLSAERAPTPSYIHTDLYVCMPPFPLVFCMCHYRATILARCQQSTERRLMEEQPQLQPPPPPTSSPHQQQQHQWYTVLGTNSNICSSNVISTSVSFMVRAAHS